MVGGETLKITPLSIDYFTRSGTTYDNYIRLNAFSLTLGHPRTPWELSEGNRWKRSKNHSVFVPFFSVGVDCLEDSGTVFTVIKRGIYNWVGTSVVINYLFRGSLFKGENTSLETTCLLKQCSEKKKK